MNVGDKGHVAPETQTIPQMHLLLHVLNLETSSFFDALALLFPVLVSFISAFGRVRVTSFLCMLVRT